MTDKAIPEITEEQLEHISPLHRLCAKEMIDAGVLRLVKNEQQKRVTTETGL